MKWSLRAGFVLHLVENQDLWMYGLMYFFFFRTVQMTTTDTAGHVGGIFAGIAYFLSRRAGIRL